MEELQDRCRKSTTIKFADVEEAYKVLKELNVKEFSALDQWIINRLEKTIKAVTLKESIRLIDSLEIDIKHTNG